MTPTREQKRSLYLALVKAGFDMHQLENGMNEYTFYTGLSVYTDYINLKATTEGNMLIITSKAFNGEYERDNSLTWFEQSHKILTDWLCKTFNK